MGRPSRSDRLASAKGRPKRRAAAKTHFFKYQFAVNPDRVEGNDLKRALQESLEEQKTTPDKKSTTNNSKNTSNNSKRLVVNSSTNSSDVSKTSYSSSSTATTNDSCGSSSATGSVKRTRSSTLSTASNGTPSSPKRARNDLKRNNDHSGKRKNECDIHPSVLSGSPATLPQLTRAIKTYSRSQLNINGHQKQPDTSNLSGPRSSTPVTTRSLNSSDIRINGSGHLDEPTGSQHIYASKSTQTTPPQLDKNDSSKQRNSNDHSSSSNGVTNIPKSMGSANEPRQPVQNQYLKFKRESKNYAYAKMTALRVNTTKSPCSYSRSSGTKKSSPTSVLNNNNNNKDSTPRSSPKGATNSNQHNLGTGQLTSTGTKFKAREDRSSMKSPSPSQSNKATSQTKDKINDIDKHSKHKNQVVNEANIPKYSLQLISIASNDYMPQDTDDLSKFSNQNQANLSITKRRLPQGSWSLIGVPEEKVLYLRDDEPARRLICYPAIKHIEGDVIQVRDSVLLRSGAKKTDLPYIAKVCAFWEDAETGGVMMSLLWYYRPEHTEEGRRPHHLPDEIFASRHRDVDTVECIEDKCYVLTFNEYCRYKKRCKMEQVNTTWSLADVTIPVSNESYPRRNRIPDVDVNPELVFCCRQIYDIRLKRSHKNPHISSKYGHI